MPKSNCEYCRSEFEYRQSGSDGRFCSLECYHKSLRPSGIEEKPTLECEHCGNTFEVPPSKVNEYRFCSEDCRRGIVKLFGEPVLKKCNECGKQKAIKSFRRQYNKKRDKKYRINTCTSCRRQSRREQYHSNETGQYQSVCLTCGEEFCHSVEDRTFCCRECSDKRNHPINGKKWCNGCGRRLKTEHFRSCPSHDDGLSSRCRRCEAIEENRRRNLPGDFDSRDIFRQWHRQNGECFWCGDPCGSSPSDAKYHIDHLTPVSRHEADPTNFPRNLVIACSECNYAKHNRLPIEFKHYRLQNGKEQTYARGVSL